MEEIQRLLRYNFNNETLLKQALDTRFCDHKEWSGYGDNHIARLVRELARGHADSIRKIVSSNDVLGSILIAKRFTQHMPWLDRQVQCDIVKLVEYQTRLVHGAPFTSGFYIPCYYDIDRAELEALPVPKTLADIFEALAHATFLDCSENWSSWKAVFKPLLAPITDFCVVQQLRDPKDLVSERSNQYFKRSVEIQPNGYRSFVANSSLYSDQTGRGRSKDSAEKALAICALGIDNWPWVVVAR